jgi:transketolase
VTIEGHTDLTFTEDVADRFTAYGWNVTTVADANDREEVEQAFHTFKAEQERPTLVVVHSHIGYGTPVEDTAKAHGEPLGPRGRQGGEALLRLARGCGLPRPGRRRRALRRRDRYTWAGGALRRGQALFTEYRATYPELADEIERMQRRDFPGPGNGDPGLSGRREGASRAVTRRARC